MIREYFHCNPKALLCAVYICIWPFSHRPIDAYRKQPLKFVKLSDYFDEFAFPTAVYTHIYIYMIYGRDQSFCSLHKYISDIHTYIEVFGLM